MKANESVVKATQYTCTGLIEGLEYTFRVSALNLAGQGKPCKQTDFITARTAVGTIISLLRHSFHDFIYFIFFIKEFNSTSRLASQQQNCYGQIILTYNYFLLKVMFLNSDRF